MIEITCETKDTLNLDQLEAFQGSLKARQDQDVNKIIRSIKQHGFAIPFFIWQHEGINHVLDGHGRLLALKKLQKAGGVIKQNLIWVKNSLAIGRSDWQWRHEPCLYGWKEGAAHFWEGRRDLTTVFDKKKNYKSLSKEELIKELNKIDQELKTTILYEDKPSRSAEHPTMKPVNLYARLIRNSSKEEDAVLDIFGGSGTAVIACAKLNRTAYVMELDPHYCDVIRKRWTIYAQEHGLDAGSGALE